MKYLLSALILLGCLNLNAQNKLNQSWIIGSGISFKAKFLTGGLTINYFDTNFKYRFMHGSSCISDSNGNLKILCNGFQLFDSLGIHIENGDSLVPSKLYASYDGHSNASQSSIILPFTDEIYYLITPTATDNQVDDWNNHVSTGFDLLLYNKIDMNANSGHGKVIRKAMSLLENTSLSFTQMMACRHSSGEGWWLLKQASDINLIYKFLVTKDSIYNVGTQGFSEPHFGLYELAGQSMFNQTGTQYATTCSSLDTDYIFLTDFDRCSGMLSKPRVYGIPDLPNNAVDSTLDVSPGGMCFSPNGQFIYLIKYHHIFQLDLFNPDSSTAWYHVANLDTTSNEFSGYGNAYIGPDDKVYISNWNALSKEMSYIEYPNIKGAGCNFCARCLRFPKRGASTVPCMPNYGLEKDSIINCPLPISPPPPSNNESLIIYPNPSTGILTLESSLLNNQENEIIIFSINGEKILNKKIRTKTNKIELDISNLANGMYILRLGNEVKKIVKE